ncbi:hypothetical protein niasHS_002902 [Heterodera schachtii]|uniref:Uncharacterized protein n=1 Tax=Heterodera schachtii TaxID=97005 RepID=A0ABD2K9C7_HETSC
MKFFILLLFSFPVVLAVSPVEKNIANTTSSSNNTSESDYETANESDPNESVEVDVSQSAQDEYSLNIGENPNKHFEQLCEKISDQQWDQFFLLKREKNMKIWRCQETTNDAAHNKCEQFKFANIALQKYLNYCNENDKIGKSGGQ